MCHGRSDLSYSREALRACSIALCRRKQFVRLGQRPIFLQHFSGCLDDFLLKAVVHLAQGFRQLCIVLSRFTDLPYHVIECAGQFSEFILFLNRDDRSHGSLRNRFNGREQSFYRAMHLKVQKQIDGDDDRQSRLQSSRSGGLQDGL
jgi:hypothetical protein